MKHEDLVRTLEDLRVVPVITIESGDQAVDLADALVAGNLPLMEITFRSDVAAEAIRRVRAERPEVTVGAGTVLTTGQVDAALKAGVQFIVAPGFNPTVVDYCLKLGVPMAPGVATPSEIEWALERGLSLLKFFPAEQSGGVKYIKAISAPYRGVRFMPTGGITPENLQTYLSVPSIIACGGSWMVKLSLIQAGEFDTITRLASEAVELARSV
ncbi:MAG: bifunctional 4-hydroxy-2-oxoglutarate aldolase/2-dehydro-3-deoxy-phosphogluconate aldolase [Spirochaetaceae bacterium]|nr:bifunctional 4-hydroxy-2-oxoglutarate aldolase/2-dehydro-3-deoxy-phosphogluconate aldolase [Spirochaetaceae bacterium]